MADYRLACSDAAYDIYAFTETWLGDNTVSSQLFDNSFTVHRHDRSASNSSKSSGGGVLLAVRSSHKSRMLYPPEHSSVEQLWVAVSGSDKTTFFCVAYFPPDLVNDRSLIDKHLLSLDWIVAQMNANDNIIILGDFNLRAVTWLRDSSGTYFPDASRSSISSASLALLDAYSTAGLRQINSVHNDNNRILDLCFISEDLRTDCSATRAPSPLVKDIQHHPPLLVALNNGPRPRFVEPMDRVSYDFGRGDFDSMNEFLQNLDWAGIFHGSDCNHAASTMSNILLYSIDQYVPKKYHRAPASPVWSNSELRHLKSAKRAALKKHSKYRTDSTRAAYSRINEQYSRLNNQLYLAHLVETQNRLRSDPRSFWRYVNDQRKQSGLPTTMTNGVLEVNSTPEIAELFRSQFSSVFSNEVVDNSDIAAAVQNVPHVSSTASQLTVTPDTVLSALVSLKSSTGCGPDNIPSLVLKRCASALAAPLATVFDISLSTGVFPDCWKDSFVFPIHKKGCKQTVSNYRGIAALSATSKLFEIVVLEHLTQSLSQHISPNQHGFMAKRSTSTNLVTFTSFITQEIEKGHQVDAIYDLSAAFDKMNHEIALAKFDKLGIKNNVLAWLRSYLVGRTMSVKIGDHESSPFTVTSGVPQGSHLGPFLFLLYMNDVNSILECFNLSYADDLKLYYVIHGHRDTSYLQQQLEAFADWCRLNRMVLNVTKCSVISFGRKRSLLHHDYCLDDTYLKRQTTVKDLGVMMDAKLDFKDHVAYIVSKASSQLGFVFRFAKKFKDVYCLKSLYCSLVRPILEYCSVVWAPFYQNEILRIEAIQRKFIRFALRHLGWQDPYNLPSYESRCKLIRLELLQSRRSVAKACFIADLLQGDVSCASLLEQVGIHVPSRSLRFHNFLYIRPARTNYGQNEPLQSMCRVFNQCYDVFDFSVSRVVNKNRFKNVLC